MPSYFFFDGFFGLGGFFPPPGVPPRLVPAGFFGEVFEVTFFGITQGPLGEDYRHLAYRLQERVEEGRPGLPAMPVYQVCSYRSL